LSYHHTPLKRVWPHPFVSCTLDIDQIPTQSSFLKAEQSQVIQPYLSKRGAPGMLSSSWPSAGLFPGDPCLLCTGEPRSGHSTPGEASPGQNYSRTGRTQGTKITYNGIIKYDGAKKASVNSNSVINSDIQSKSLF